MDIPISRNSYGIILNTYCKSWTDVYMYDYVL